MMLFVRRVRFHRASRPLFVVTLALTVGVALIVFTIVNAIWLRPTGVVRPDRVVTIMRETANTGRDDVGGYSDVSYLQSVTAFSAVAGQVSTSGEATAFRPQILLTSVGRDVETIAVTPAYFRVLGLSITGRDFRADDDRRGAEPVAIISDRLWRRAFDRRMDVIGQVVHAEPIDLRIIGVAPTGFEGARRGEHADLWIPSNLVPRVAAVGSDDPGWHSLIVLARLRDGVTPAEAVRRIAREVDSRIPFVGAAIPLTRVFGAPDSPTRIVREGRNVSVVGILAALVLVAGCATLAALLLLHYERRRREFAVRVALGVSRGRLTAQLATELVAPVLFGTAGALGVCVLGLRVIPALRLPGGVDLARLDLSLDWRVLLAGLTVCLVAVVTAAIVPVVRATRADVGRDLVSVTTVSSSQRLRRALLALHAAATVVVLVAAGLFVRAVTVAFDGPPGFDVDHTVFVRAEPRTPFVPLHVSVHELTLKDRMADQQLFDRLRALPGARSVAVGEAPLGVDALAAIRPPKNVTVDGRNVPLRIGSLSGGDDFLAAIGVRLLAGRTPTDADRGRPYGVIVTASLARRLWPRQAPLGQTFFVRASAYRVVGVAQDFAFGSLTAPSDGVLVARRTLANLSGEATFVVHTDRPVVVAAEVRRLIPDVFPGASYVDVATGRDLVARDLARQRLGAWFFSGFGLVALGLAVASVFGLVAHVTEARRREFGIRLALGASTRQVIREAAVVGLGPVVAGTVAGLAAAALLSRVVRAMLVGIGSLDAPTYVVVGLMIVAGAAAAGTLAARRLRRISPSEALRAE
jgi:predicted permease